MEFLEFIFFFKSISINEVVFKIRYRLNLIYLYLFIDKREFKLKDFRIC